MYHKRRFKYKVIFGCRANSFDMFRHENICRTITLDFKIINPNAGIDGFKKVEKFIEQKYRIEEVSLLNFDLL